MRKPRPQPRADEPMMIGIASGGQQSPEPRVTAFVWSDEQDLEHVLAEVRHAA